MSEEKMTSDVLLVRHLPRELNICDQEDLLKHFGAIQVKCIGNKGPLKYAAFAQFPDNKLANKALQRLHQLTFLGSTLTVEFSKKTFTEIHEHTSSHSVTAKLDILKKDKQSDINKKKIDETPDVVKIQNDIDGISEQWNVRYAINDKLRYSYPPPNVNILTNIANALAAVPKFYVQVLHLMNKMNLPAPFGMVTKTPPIPEEPPPILSQSIEMPSEPKPFQEGEQDMDMSSTEESELESESDEDKGKVSSHTAALAASNANKRKALKTDKNLARKKLKVQMAISTPKTAQAVAKPEEVFDQTSSMAKKANFKFGQLTSAGALTSESKSLHQDEDHPTGTVNSEISSVCNKSESPNVKEPVNETENTNEQSGFGKLAPTVNPQVTVGDDSDGGEEEWGAGKFISSRILRKDRLSHREMKEYNVFKNYQPGEPNTRLYVKNLAKQTVEKDLHYIFGKYVNWEKESEKNMFDIRLMKEGRMKGQCFITLGNTRRAEDALKDTNGFMLNGKPMVVQFARSAKPKETQEKSNSGS